MHQPTVCNNQLVWTPGQRLRRAAPCFAEAATRRHSQRSRKLRGIKPYLPVRRPRVAEALAEAQAEREGGIKY